MSKKVVIVPQKEFKWCRVYNDGSDIEFHYHYNRKNARCFASGGNGSVRKVSKIVYHYE